VIFLFQFFPITFLGYYIIKDNWKNYWLLGASLVFYAWGEPKHIFLILVSICMNFCLGLLIEKQSLETKKKIALVITIVFNVGVLVYFKYSNFFGEIFSSITGINVADLPLISKSPMPIGISFFTFQILSYQIDVYRRSVPAQKSISKLALYIMLFPQMIAGPIVRYSDIAKEIDSRKISFQLVYSGLQRFMIGFSKKVLISNTMAVVADHAYANIGVSGALSWFGTICYMFQIYYDFSGYSDMAIGMGEMAGFHFQENFKYPYAANSVRDFWRRWHISLSSWFRDYLYIPLGGNRKGQLRTYLNLLIVFSVTGLWHGASYNFIIWGLYHGLFLCVERMAGKRLENIPVLFMRVYTMLEVLFGWVLFRADTLSDAVATIATMFSFHCWNWNAVLHIVNKEIFFFFIISILLMWGIPQKVKRIFTNHRLLKDICILSLFTISILYTIGTDFNPFIYFRF